MNRLEGFLLERMSVRRWLVAAAVIAIGFGAGGYVAGREAMKSEIREQLVNVSKAFDDGMRQSSDAFKKRLASRSAARP